MIHGTRAVIIPVLLDCVGAGQKPASIIACLGCVYIFNQVSKRTCHSLFRSGLTTNLIPGVLRHRCKVLRPF